MTENNLVQKSKFELLRDKNILAILDGDMKFGKLKVNNLESEILICMPYLSGPTLCEISCKFGLPTNYPLKGGALSRWAYLDELLLFCIKNDKVSRLLNYLFSKNQFSSILNGYSHPTIELVHKKIIKHIIEEINKILYFGENELVQVENNFIIRSITSTITPEIPLIKNIDRNYINDILNRSLNDINEGYFDSAITKARTLLEEVFCYVIEHANQEPSSKGDVGLLYNQVKTIYNMKQNQDYDKRINSLLSGLEKILSAIAEMRNKGSDAHGLGLKRIKIEEHIARLFVNSSATMADFILAVYEKKNNLISH